MIRIVKMSFELAYAQDFKTKFEDIKLNILSCRGCRSLRLVQSQEDGGIFFTISEWDDEDDLENYRNSALFRTTWAHIKPWFNAKPEAWSTTQLFSSL